MAKRNRRARSRTTVPQSPALSIKWIVDGTADVKSEVLAYTNGGTDIENTVRRNEIFFRLSLAAKGQLTPPKQVAPVDQNTEIWEIRWEAEGRHLRMYHGEPPSIPDYIIPLRFHRKSTSGTKAEIWTKQTIEMRIASFRYETWRASNWFI